MIKLVGLINKFKQNENKQRKECCDESAWRRELRRKFPNRISQPVRTDYLVNEKLNNGFLNLMLEVENGLFPFYSIFANVHWRPNKFKCGSRQRCRDARGWVVEYYTQISFGYILPNAESC